jgi:hypothetical protein
VRGAGGAGLDIVGTEEAGRDATAQDEQAGVLAGVERVGDVGGRLPAEAVGLVVIAGGGAVAAFGVALLGLRDHWCLCLRFPCCILPNG